MSFQSNRMISAVRRPANAPKQRLGAKVGGAADSKRRISTGEHLDVAALI